MMQTRPDIFVSVTTIPSASPRERGDGLEMRYGFHASPFGEALIVSTDLGVAAIGFREATDDPSAALADITRRWPKARFVENPAAIGAQANRIFNPETWDASNPLPVLLIGTDFEIAVWELLLKIPLGTTSNYSTIANTLGKPSASRAVGAAVGRNPISFIVPCHRVIGRDGGLCGYHWGLTRKRIMLDWEQSLLGLAEAGDKTLQPLLL